LIALVSSGIKSRLPRPANGLSLASDADLAHAITRATPDEAPLAEAELCRRFVPRVRLYGRKHLADPDAANDLVQRTLEITLQKLRRGEVTNPEQIASFVLGVARLQAHELRRRGRHEHVTADLEPALLLALPPEPEALGAERLSECLQELGERERSVVLLSFYAEQDSVEVGKALGMSAGNVRVVRHRAVEHLRQCMGLSKEAP